MTSLPPTPTVGVFLPHACLQHRYIRNKDTSAIVERPERLRAVNVGLAGAIARLESLQQTKETNDSDDLAAALDKLSLASSTQRVVDVVPTKEHTESLLTHPAVKFVHGDIDGDVYLENLVRWAKESTEKIEQGDSEIPQGLAQGDLYLCPTSINAIQSAVGTVCDAIDTVFAANTPIVRAFVSVRPPGHHCGEDTPSGFCFVNNVAVGAAHAHLKHGINRIVILDIDLHHGNGTQSIVWQINEETQRKTLETDARRAAGETVDDKPGLKVYYGSLHDILSYPCEDASPPLVQAASTSLSGAHGQWIQNVHLETYTSNASSPGVPTADFWEIYEQKYKMLLRQAEAFVRSTEDDGDVLVFMSTGFDASEHESPYMSRHNRRVPTSFYHRFSADVLSFANKYARGRVVSVLEGGYGDRALGSGAMAHLCGLSGAQDVDEAWWDIENLIKLEKATAKKRRGAARNSLAANDPTDTPWLERALSIFTTLDEGAAQYAVTTTPRRSAVPVPPSSRTLRERKPKGPDGSVTMTTPGSTPQRGTGLKVDDVSGTDAGAKSDDSSGSSGNEMGATGVGHGLVKKPLPRVVLKLGPDPSRVDGANLS